MYFIGLPYFFLNLSGLGADVELLWPFRISICYCVFSTAFNGGRLTCSTMAKPGQVSPPPKILLVNLFLYLIQCIQSNFVHSEIFQSHQIQRSYKKNSPLIIHARMQIFNLILVAAMTNGVGYHFFNGIYGVALDPS